ncbi:MAG: GNAT family N-acetyltransferase, partial [Polyangiales bacterium]
LQVGDDRELLEYYRRNDDRFRPWDPTPPADFFTAEFWRARVDAAIDERRQGTSLRLILLARAPGDRPSIVGVASFTNIVRGVFKSCFLGYSADRAHEGHGLMREGLEASIRHLFEVVGLHRVQASYRPTNDRSGSLLRRLGFDVEGYARDYLFLDGAWRDSIVTARRAPTPK